MQRRPVNVRKVRRTWDTINHLLAGAGLLVYGAIYASRRRWRRLALVGGIGVGWLSRRS